MHPALVFDHLASMSTPIGLFEHALFTRARPEHGFCLDDVARGLVVTARQPDPSAVVADLRRIYLRFVLDAQDAAGRFHNRRSVAGAWTDTPNVDDHWGRALWALGTVAATTSDEDVRDAALEGAGGVCDCGRRPGTPWRMRRSAPARCSASAPATMSRSAC